jgi:DNA-binding response OmpR family regulator
MKILLIEDDELIADNLKLLLERETYVTDLASSVEDGIEKLLTDEYDLLICDRRLPDGDGMEVVKIARSNDLSIPSLMLTAKNSSDDIIAGLDAGADDYLPKPFDSTVLLARVRALLRRRKKIAVHPIVSVGKVVIDSNTREVKYKGETITLSPKEYGVLEYLLANRGKIVERIDILTHVWNEEVDLFSNTVDVHIRYLRQKLGNDLINTVRGKGYVIWDK